MYGGRPGPQPTSSSARLSRPGGRLRTRGSAVRCATLGRMSRMLDEIREQPAALERTLRASRKPAEELARALAARRPKLVVLAARGTSDNAALFGRYLIEITTGIPVSMAAPSITTLYRAPLQWQDALVVGISQSGESTDTNRVVK